jgi:hypothetical protein
MLRNVERGRVRRERLLARKAAITPNLVTDPAQPPDAGGPVSPPALAPEEDTP